MSNSSVSSGSSSAFDDKLLAQEREEIEALREDFDALQVHLEAIQTYIRRTSELPYVRYLAEYPCVRDSRLAPPEPRKYLYPITSDEGEGSSEQDEYSSDEEASSDESSSDESTVEEDSPEEVLATKTPRKSSETNHSDRRKGSLEVDKEKHSKKTNGNKKRKTKKKGLKAKKRREPPKDASEQGSESEGDEPEEIKVKKSKRDEDAEAAVEPAEVIEGSPKDHQRHVKRYSGTRPVSSRDGSTKILYQRSNVFFK